MFELVRKAERYILVNTRRRFVIEGGGPREEIPELPQDAVREVLFNAFAHCDRISRGIVQIDIYNDSVEITNPGWFIDGQDPAAHVSGNDRSSLSRNMLVVNTLHKSGDIEAYGTGIPRIRDACKEAGVEFEYKRVPIGTCFIFHRKDAFAASDKVRESSDKVPISSDKLASLITEWGSLSETEQVTCLAMAERGAVRSAEIATLTGLTQRGAQKALGRLVERGIVETNGANRNRTYSLRSDLRD